MTGRTTSLEAATAVDISCIATHAHMLKEQMLDVPDPSFLISLLSSIGSILIRCPFTADRVMAPTSTRCIAEYLGVHFGGRARRNAYMQRIVRQMQP